MSDWREELQQARARAQAKLQALKPTAAPVEQTGTLTDEQVQNLKYMLTQGETPSLGEQAQDFASRLVGGATSVVPDLMYAAGQVVGSDTIRGASEAVRQKTENIIPPSNPYRQTLGGDVGGFVGGVIPYLGAAELKLAAIPKWARMAVLGGAQGFGQGTREANLGGATTTQAIEAGLAQGAIGAAQAIPVGALSRAAERPFLKSLPSVLSQNVGYATGSQVLSNLAKKATYAPEQPVGEGVGQAALGAALGTPLIHGATHLNRPMEQPETVGPKRPRLNLTAQGFTPPANPYIPWETLSPTAQKAWETVKDRMAPGMDVRIRGPVTQQEAGRSELARANDVEVLYVEGPDGKTLPEQGVYYQDPETKKQVILIDANQPADVKDKAVFWHEMTHWLKEQHPEVHRALLEHFGVEEGELRKLVGERLQVEPDKLTPEQYQNEALNYQNELLAGHLDEAFQRPELLEKILSNPKTPLQAIGDALLPVLQKMGLAKQAKPSEVKNLERFAEAVSVTKGERALKPGEAAQKALRVADTYKGVLRTEGGEAQPYKAPEGLAPEAFTIKGGKGGAPKVPVKAKPAPKPEPQPEMGDVFLDKGGKRWTLVKGDENGVFLHREDQPLKTLELTREQFKRRMVKAPFQEVAPKPAGQEKPAPAPKEVPPRQPESTTKKAPEQSQEVPAPRAPSAQEEAAPQQHVAAEEPTHQPEKPQLPAEQKAAIHKAVEEHNTEKSPQEVEAGKTVAEHVVAALENKKGFISQSELISSIIAAHQAPEGEVAPMSDEEYVARLTGAEGERETPGMAREGAEPTIGERQPSEGKRVPLSPAQAQELFLELKRSVLDPMVLRKEISVRQRKSEDGTVELYYGPKGAKASKESGLERYREYSKEKRLKAAQEAAPEATEADALQQRAEDVETMALRVEGNLKLATGELEGSFLTKDQKRAYADVSDEELLKFLNEAGVTDPEAVVRARFKTAAEAAKLRAGAMRVIEAGGTMGDVENWLQDNGVFFFSRAPKIPDEFGGIEGPSEREKYMESMTGKLTRLIPSLLSDGKDMWETAPKNLDSRVRNWGGAILQLAKKNYDYRLMHTMDGRTGRFIPPRNFTDTDLVRFATFDAIELIRRQLASRVDAALEQQGEAWRTGEFEPLEEHGGTGMLEPGQPDYVQAQLKDLQQFNRAAELLGKEAFRANKLSFELTPYDVPSEPGALEAGNRLREGMRERKAGMEDAFGEYDHPDYESAGMFSTAFKGSRWELAEETKMQALHRLLVDEYSHPRRMFRSVLEQGGTLGDTPEAQDKANVDAHLTNMPGRARHGFNLIDRLFKDPIIRTARKGGIKLEGWDEEKPTAGMYLYALHAHDRNVYMRDTFKKAKWDLEENPGSGLSDSEAQKILDKVESLPNKQAYHELRRLNQGLQAHRLAAEVASGVLTQFDADTWRQNFGPDYVPLRTVGDRDPITKAAFKARGRKTTADELVAFSLKQAYDTVLRAERNRVYQSVANFVLTNKDPDLWRVYTKGERIPLRDREDALLYYNNGRKRWIVFSDKGIPRSLSRQGVYKADVITKTIGRLSRFYARMSTTWNPEFLVPNLARDIQDAKLNLSSEGKANLVKNLPKNAWLASRAMWRVSSDPGAKGAWENMARRFKEAGGETGWVFSEDVTELATKLKKDVEFKDLKAYDPRKAYRALKKVGAFVDRANNALENGTRLAVFKAAVESGLSDQASAKIAKGVTVDFNRRGEMGPLINALYTFANANIQGTVRTFSGFHKNPTKMKFAAALVAGSMGLAQLNRMLLSDRDEDGVLYWDKKSDWEKTRNLIVMIPGGKGRSIDIPLPWGWGLFNVLGTKIDTVTHTKQSLGQFLGGMALASKDAFNPLGSSPTWTQFFTPTIADPLVQIAENVDFSGRPVAPVKDPFERPQKPNSERFFSTVSPGALKIARSLNSLTGGSIVEPGVVDVSPEWIELMAGQVFGGLGMATTKFARTVENTFRGRFNLDDLPMVRRFTRGIDEERQVKADFYDALNDVALAEAKVKKLGDKEAQQSPTYQNRRVMDQAQRRVNGLKTRLNKARDEATRAQLESIILSTMKRAAHAYRQGVPL